jgi:hypothetical protein
MRGAAEFCQKTSHFYLWGGQMGMGQTGAREGGFARLGAKNGKPGQVILHGAIGTLL